MVCRAAIRGALQQPLRRPRITLFRVGRSFAYQRHAKVWTPQRNNEACGQQNIKCSTFMMITMREKFLQLADKVG